MSKMDDETIIELSKQAISLRFAGNIVAFSQYNDEEDEPGKIEILLKSQDILSIKLVREVGYFFRHPEPIAGVFKNPQINDIVSVDCKIVDDELIYVGKVVQLLEPSKLHEEAIVQSIEPFDHIMGQIESKKIDYSQGHAQIVAQLWKVTDEDGLLKLNYSTYSMIRSRMTDLRKSLGINNRTHIFNLDKHSSNFNIKNSLGIDVYGLNTDIILETINEKVAQNDNKIPSEMIDCALDINMVLSPLKLLWIGYRDLKDFLHDDPLKNL